VSLKRQSSSMCSMDCDFRGRDGSNFGFPADSFIFVLRPSGESRANEKTHTNIFLENNIITSSPPRCLNIITINKKLESVGECTPMSNCFWSKVAYVQCNVKLNLMKSFSFSSIEIYSQKPPSICLVKLMTRGARPREVTNECLLFKPKQKNRDTCWLRLPQYHYPFCRC
jgi:hypothetical protein